ncbi:smf Mn2+ and Fe2+ transporter-like protein [Panus rudis PR-1116 ss-1]|nr:smf Mn2+ and Fe2+ transporter-like protein [Panus rudis PR-1116 ss-1]
MASTASQQPQSTLKSTARIIARHVLKHTGVGIVCAVAYFDPGNWGVDLQAGSQFGYKLLFVVLVAGIFAVFLQVLASRLGCVTGLDLASHCRLLLYNRPKHTRLYRWLLLYPLYILSEIAIISTDLAELLGSAIALCLLFPQLPLWAGVLLTASDVLFLLALGDPLGGRPVRLFELLIAALVFTVLVCMAVIISKVGVHWGDAFDGFVPSGTLFKSGGLYTSIGIIGATVMPHSLFLGSALATQNRLASTTEDKALFPVNSASSSQSGLTTSTVVTSPHSHWHTIKSNLKDAFRVIPAAEFAREPATHAERENRPLAIVRAHLYHGIVDIVISLLGYAVLINSLILILASAVFFYGSGAGSGGPASLFDAHDLLKDIVGKPAATLFALALLASGQSSSIIATMAGQIVSEGFLRWRVSPIMRRLLTRSLGLVPSMVVAIGVGRSGVDTLLVASQVALSIVLPFIVFPLLYLTSSRSIMSAKSSTSVELSSQAPVIGDHISPQVTSGTADPELAVAEEVVDYSNGKIVKSIGYFIWLVVVAANIYAIVSLGLGEEV